MAGFPNDRKLVNKLIQNKHNYKGHITRNSKLNLFSENDCIIFCSPMEGSPIILLEAMASGVFIISTNVGFIPELLGQNYPFMVNPNFKDLSRIIDKYFLLSKDERIEIMQNMRKRYISLFSYENWSKKTQRIFKS